VGLGGEGTSIAHPASRPTARRHGAARRRSWILGYFVLTWGYDLEWDGCDAFLTELFLVPAARGHGHGSGALVAAEAVAREHGARSGASDGSTRERGKITIAPACKSPPTAIAPHLTGPGQECREQETRRRDPAVRRKLG